MFSVFIEQKLTSGYEVVIFIIVIIFCEYNLSIKITIHFSLSLSRFDVKLDLFHAYVFIHLEASSPFISKQKIEKATENCYALVFSIFWWPDGISQRLLDNCKKL